MEMTIEEAKEILRYDIQTDGRLYSHGLYLTYHPGDSYATLDGDFLADKLEAIAVYMQTIQQKDQWK